MDPCVDEETSICVVSSPGLLFEGPVVMGLEQSTSSGSDEPREPPATLGAHGTFVAMNNEIAQSVPHLHVHVVPRSKGHGLKGFFWPRHEYDGGKETETYRAKVAAALG